MNRNCCVNQSYILNDTWFFSSRLPTEIAIIKSMNYALPSMFSP